MPTASPTRTTMAAAPTSCLASLLRRAPMVSSISIRASIPSCPTMTRGTSIRTARRPLRSPASTMAGRGRSAPSTSRCFSCATAFTLIMAGITSTRSPMSWTTLSTRRSGTVAELTSSRIAARSTRRSIFSPRRSITRPPAAACSPSLNGSGPSPLRGGYTIANGVVIENATGGSGDDMSARQQCRQRA